MDNALMTTIRPADETTEAFLRECAMMGEIKRRRDENNQLRQEIAANTACIKRMQAARRASYRRQLEADKRWGGRMVAAVQMVSLFLSGAGVAALMVALAIMVMGG